MTDVQVWGFSVPGTCISQNERDYLSGLPPELPTIEWVWEEMDRVWHKFGLNNSRPLTGQPICKYYSHPVWLMNGLFTALDPVSASHRDAIARYVGQRKVKSVADYGGGFGELARAITRTTPEAVVSIVEPYPSHLGLEQLQRETRIEIVPGLSSNDYDAVIAQDVLEHVENPIQLASKMASAVREGGFIIFANCFYPVIQCHLPSTFHLRHNFIWAMKELGLRYLGTVEGAEHAQVFERLGQLDLKKARRAEQISRLVGTPLNKLRAIISKIKYWSVNL